MLYCKLKCYTVSRVANTQRSGIMEKGIQRRSDLTIGRDREQESSGTARDLVLHVDGLSNPQQHKPKKTVMPSEEELRARNREPEHENAEL